MVIATQNPIEQAGTYRLPEAQLDRFLMKASVGYPDHEATIAVLADAKTRDRAKTLSPLIASNVIVEMARLADEIHVDPAILGYVSRIAEESRRHRRSSSACRSAAASPTSAAPRRGPPPRVAPTSSPTTSSCSPSRCSSHRLLLGAEAQFAGTTVEQCVDQILGDIAPPAERASA